MLLSLLAPDNIWRRSRNAIKARRDRDSFRINLEVDVGLALWVIIITAFAAAIIPLQNAPTSFGGEIVHRFLVFLLAIYMVVTTIFLPVVYLPTLWLRMLFAAPQTMLRFCIVRVLLTRFIQWLRQLKPSPTITKPLTWHSRIVPLLSSSTLFSLSTLPYRLFAIKNYLLLPQ